MPFRNLAVRATITLAFAAAAASPALAQPTDAQKSAMKANCRSDFMANCMSTSPGSKEALECLQHNLAKLSPGCHAAVEATMPKPAAAAPPSPPPPVAPPPKAATVAPAAPPPAALAAPAAPAAAPPPQHAAKKAEKEKTKIAAPKPAPLTPPPPVAVAPPQPDPAVILAKAARVPLPKRLAVFRACNHDQAAVCPTVKRGGGRLIACMAMHPDALSPHCRRTIAEVMGMP
jgi:hypothetical protein